MGDAPTPVDPNDWVAKRLAEIDQIPDASKRVIALVGLASELLPSKSQVIKAAIEAAQLIEDKPENKAHALSISASLLPESDRYNVLKQALEAAKSIPDDSLITKVKALSTIASLLPESDRYNVLKQALEAAKSIPDNSPAAKVSALSSISSHLPDSQQHEVLDEALAIAHSIDEIERKVQALYQLFLNLRQSRSSRRTKRSPHGPPLHR